jgi:hypothetical protein
MSTFTEESEPVPLDPNYMVDQADFARLERKVDKLTDALNRLVIFEERQMNQSNGLSKAEKDIAYIQGITTSLERKVDQWINRGIGAWFIAGIVFAGFQFYLSQK